MVCHQAEVTLVIEDFNTIAAKTPLIGNLKPFGKYVMEHVDQVGGVPAVMAMLLQAGLLHPHVLTCTGKTLAQNLEGVALRQNPDPPTVWIFAAARQCRKAFQCRPAACPRRNLLNVSACYARWLFRPPLRISSSYLLLRDRYGTLFPMANHVSNVVASPSQRTARRTCCSLSRSRTPCRCSTS